jgi:hypothetical protein
MTTTDRSATWKQKFKRHYADNVAALGGASITSSRRTIAKIAAVLQVEHDQMAARFASGNASTDDVTAYIKLFDSIQTLFESCGFTPAVVVKTDDGSALRAAMVDAFSRIIDARKREEVARAAANGIIIQENETYQAALERTLGITAPRSTTVIIDNVGVVDAPRVEQPPPRSTPRLVTPDATSQTAAPQPPSNEPSTTQKYLEWGGGTRMSPSDWSGDLPWR